jgi:glucokinase
LKSCCRIAKSSGDAAPSVSRQGLVGDDRLCTEALSLFVSIDGAEAGASFVAKGRLSPMLERTPVKVALNADAGLLGAAELASRFAL